MTASDFQKRITTRSSPNKMDVVSYVESLLTNHTPGETLQLTMIIKPDESVDCSVIPATADSSA